MRSPTWAEVVLAAVSVVQTLGLAWIGRRGIVLPPTNRRRKPSSRDRVTDGSAADGE